MTGPTAEQFCLVKVTQSFWLWCMQTDCVLHLELTRREPSATGEKYRSAEISVNPASLVPFILGSFLVF